MDYRLPVLTVGLIVIGFGVTRAFSDSKAPTAVALPAAPVSSTAPSQGSSQFANRGTTIVGEAIARLGKHQTISAKVRHRSQLFGQRLVGSGVYLQKRFSPDPLVRFSLSIGDDRPDNLLHVCDGRFLWIRENSGPLSRVDLRVVRTAQLANETATPPSMHLGGGLVQLLQSMRLNFNFSEPQSMEFQQVPVWAIVCQWKPERLAMYLPKDHPALANPNEVQLSALPQQMPDHVLIFLGQDDFFPYRVDFRSSQPRSPGTGSRAQSLVTMELFEVQFNAPINPALFVYKPGDIEIIDGTEDYLAQQRRNATRAVTRRDQDGS